MLGNSSPKATSYEKKNKNTFFAFIQRASVISLVSSGEGHGRYPIFFHFRYALQSDTSVTFCRKSKDEEQSGADYESAKVLIQQETQLLRKTKTASPTNVSLCFDVIPRSCQVRNTKRKQ